LPFEKQLALIYAWFFEMWERVKIDNGAVAEEARADLQTLLLNSVAQLLPLGLGRKQCKAKQWAGIMLASIGASVWKHDEKLSKANNAYLDEKKKVGAFRADVMFPESPVIKLAQAELKRAIHYRKRLLLIKAVGKKVPPQFRWEAIARKQRIPEKYFATVKLPEFSNGSRSQWCDLLWPLISEKIDPSKLPKLAKRDINTYDIKTRSRYLSDSQKTVCDHFATLARLRDSGVLVL